VSTMALQSPIDNSDIGLRAGGWVLDRFGETAS